jgi:3-deoxy-manno-octulosonate cytidylyltransferase (CMP-KDO synthetase)
VAARLEKTPIIINVQGDEPLVDPRLIDRLVESMRAHGNVPMMTAVTPFPQDADVSNPHAVKVVVDRNGDALYFSRSVIPHYRDALAAGKPPVYLRHLGIYAYRRKFLIQLVKMKPTMLERAEQLEQLRALHCGARIRVLTTNHLSPGVDTLEDVQAVEALLKAKAAKD